MPFTLKRMLKIREKNIDMFGRLSLPKKWRLKHGSKVMIIESEDSIKIIPRKSKLSDFFDSIKVDLKADLSDWHAVKKELMHKKKNEIY